MASTPRMLGKYELLERIAFGGMGVLYAGRNPSLDQRVAIKVLRADFAGPDAGDRFIREARAVSQLKHPNIVRVFDFGEDGDHLYFVMEFVKGETLKNAIERRAALTLPQRVQIFGQICAAMSYAHRAGWIHRDLKPGNIMLDDEDGLVKVLDFGLARRVDVPASQMLTRVTGIMGTLNYMSPEQATGAANIDHRTDIFAATVVLYELLTYLPAFNAKTEEEALRAVLHADAIPPSTHNPDLPPEIDDVVARGLAKSVDDRFESIEALHTAVTGAFKRHDALALSDQTLLRSDSRRLSDITPINVSRAGERSSESARHAQSESPAPSRSRASAPVAQSRETDRQPQVVPAPAAQDSRPVSSAARPRSWSRFATAAVVILLTVVAGGVTWWLTNQAEPPNARPPVGEPPPEKPAGATSISTSPDTPEKKGATSSPIQSAVPAKDGQQARKETPAQPEAKTDVSAQPSHTEAEDRAAIERTLTQLAQAYNRLDPEAAASLMVDEPVDEFRQAFARYTAVTMVLQPTSITVSGNGARVVSRERRTFTNLRGNTESGPEETVVYQFRRIGNTWRIAAREVQ